MEWIGEMTNKEAVDVLFEHLKTIDLENPDMPISKYIQQITIKEALFQAIKVLRHTNDD